MLQKQRGQTPSKSHQLSRLLFWEKGEEKKERTYQVNPFAGDGRYLFLSSSLSPSPFCLFFTRREWTRWAAGERSAVGRTPRPGWGRVVDSGSLATLKCDEVHRKHR